MNRSIDLRSDTVTAPGPEMRRAIAEAEVGDDVLARDPTVARLERRVADLLGKEEALFVPSGSMANLIAVRLHCRPGSEIITDHGAHVMCFEAGAAQALGGVAFALVDAERGVFRAEDVTAAVRPDFPDVPRTALVWAENTHNTAGGCVWPLERLDAVAGAARRAGLPLHLDGARLWNAAVATGETPARIARDADTVSVCLSKGLGAPVGSLIVGTRAHREEAWILRKQLGGGMRQSGVLAAAGLYALDHNLERLAEDHASARFLAERVAGLPGVRIDVEGAHTNIVMFDVRDTGRDDGQFVREAEARGLLLAAFGGGLVRATTHRDVTREQVRRAGDTLEEMLSGKPAGAGRTP